MVLITINVWLFFGLLTDTSPSIDKHQTKDERSQRSAGGGTPVWVQVVGAVVGFLAIFAMIGVRIWLGQPARALAIEQWKMAVIDRRAKEAEKEADAQKRNDERRKLRLEVEKLNREARDEEPIEPPHTSSQPNEWGNLNIV
ncbi:MAG: hypothetical protein M1817_003638 [Caeruleum heppii]|nr:MAG: hypothetical protein M1817_003638 [Caeruleum heppii]